MKKQQQQQQKQSKPIVVKQILPNYFIYDIKLEGILFYTGLTFLLLAFILTIVFIASIKKETTLDGQEVTHSPGNASLIVSLVFALLALGCLGYVLVFYLRVFGFEQSNVFYSLLGGMIVGLGVLITDIIYLNKPDNLCPDGKEFNSTYGQCVPICAPGYILDPNTLTCKTGCRSSSDCPEGVLCVAGDCCASATDIKCGNICCTKEETCYTAPAPIYNFCCGKDKKLCGSTCCYANETCKDGQCVAMCPDESQTCSREDVCVKVNASYYPSLLPSPSVTKDGYVYACAKPPDGCDNLATPYAFPAGLDNFYYAYGSPTSDSDIQTILKSVPGSDEGKNAEKSIQSQDPNKGHLGAYCGLENPFRIMSFSFDQKKPEACTLQTCLNETYPGLTEQLNPVLSSDKSTLHCNMLLYPNKTSTMNRSGHGHGQESNDDPDMNNYYVTSFDPQTKTYSTQTKPFSGKDPSQNTNYSVAPQSYVEDCTQISCPKAGDAKFKCSDNPPPGWVDDIGQAKKGCFYANDPSGTTVCETCSDPETGCYHDSVEGHTAYYPFNNSDSGIDNKTCTTVEDC